MITKTQIEQFNVLQEEKTELQTELKRINDFNSREPNSRDTERAINQGKIFVKFAGTACMLPVATFTGELTKRKKELEDRLVAIEEEIAAI